MQNQIDPIEIEALALVAALKTTFEGAMEYAQSTWTSKHPIAIQKQNSADLNRPQ